MTQAETLLRFSTSANQTERRKTMATAKTTTKTETPTEVTPVADMGSLISFGGEPPTATRDSRYVPIYEALKAKPGSWANVTKAVEAVNASREKPVKLSAAATTFRNNDFMATERGGELWAVWIGEE